MLWVFHWLPYGSSWIPVKPFNNQGIPYCGPCILWKCNAASVLCDCIVEYAPAIGMYTLDMEEMLSRDEVYKLSWHVMRGQIVPRWMLRKYSSLKVNTIMLLPSYKVICKVNVCRLNFNIILNLKLCMEKNNFNFEKRTIFW